MTNKVWTAAAIAASLTGCATTPKPAAAPPPGMQYLYGSGEAAALYEQAFNALTDHVRATLAATGPRAQAVLAAGSRVDRPLRTACDPAAPTAVVFDMDETAVFNLGYEHDDARTGRGYDDARWKRFEATGGDSVVAAPGAVAAFAALRAMGVTPIVNSNRSAASADATAAALRGAGLGDFRHGETLFLNGDIDGLENKDGRRAAIAARWCVLALGGDQLGDFSGLFAGTKPVRRAAAMSPAMHDLFGRVWFVLPNPVYGAGLGSGWDDTFPPDKRWTDRGAR